RRRAGHGLRRHGALSRPTAASCRPPGGRAQPGGGGNGDRAGAAGLVRVERKLPSHPWGATQSEVSAFSVFSTANRQSALWCLPRERPDLVFLRTIWEKIRGRRLTVCQARIIKHRSRGWGVAGAVSGPEAVAVEARCHALHLGLFVRSQIK